MNDHTIDPRVIDKIRKLMALAGDAGATEGEASVAASKAQSLMEAHNLSIASIEAAGGSSGVDGKRVKDTADDKKYRTVYVWQRDLMKSIAELNFCHCSLRWQSRSNTSDTFAGYELIGRAANVASTRVMFEYLTQTIDRLARQEAVLEGEHIFSKFAASFREGAAGRVVDRLKYKRREAVSQAETKAKEEAARRSHPSYAGSTLSAIILTDVIQDEADLNEDMRCGRDPGTTSSLRRKRAAKEAAVQAKIKEVQDAGYSWDVAWRVANGAMLEEAIHLEKVAENARMERAAKEKPETEAQARKRREREERESDRYWEQERNRQRKEEARIDSRGFRRGQDAGKDIGLDAQIDAKTNRRLG